MLICACQQSPKKHSVPATPTKDSVVAKVEIPKKVPTQKPVLVDTLPKDFYKLLKKFYRDLVVFHDTAKVIDPVTGRDFADVPPVCVWRDTVTHDSITALLRVRTDTEDVANPKLFVRYECSTKDSTVATLFYVWAEREFDKKSKKYVTVIKYDPITCDCESKSDEPKNRSVTEDDMRVVMRFFLQYLASKSGVFYLV